MASPILKTQIGQNGFMPLPAEAMEHLGVSIGDIVYVMDTPDGVILTAQNPDFDEELDN